MLISSPDDPPGSDDSSYISVTLESYEWRIPIHLERPLAEGGVQEDESDPGAEGYAFIPKVQRGYEQQ